MYRKNIRVRKFNRVGIERMINFTDSLKSYAPNSDPPYSLLSDNTCTAMFEYEVFVTDKVFRTRYELAEYFNTVFSEQSGCSFKYIERDQGIWTWLTLFFFEVISKRNKEGRWQGGSIVNWIPHFEEWNKYYRHLLAGPSRVYNAHIDNPDVTRVLLANPPDTPGEVYEQLASRMEYATNPEVLKTASILYLNRDGKLKRGAAGKEGGSSRRLAQILSQLDVNWDLLSMTAEEIISMLPGEFSKFLNSDDD